MSMQMSKLKLHIESGTEDDAEELERLTLQLKEELLGLDVEAVELVRTEKMPHKAKSPGAVDLGTLLLTLAASGGVITTLINVLKSWLNRHERRSITLEIGGDKLEVTGVSSEEQQRLIDSWLNRRKTDNE